MSAPLPGPARRWPWVGAVVLGAAAALLARPALGHAWVPLVAGALAGGALAVAACRLRARSAARQAAPVHQHQEEFSRALLLIAGLEELLQNALPRIQSWLGASAVLVLTADGPGIPYGVRASIGCRADELEGVRLSDTARLVQWLYTNETCLVPAERPEVMDFLGLAERDLLTRLNVAVVLPLVAANRLAGVILVCGTSGPLSERLPAVWAMVPPLALALDNAALYEQQRLRLRRLSRAERLATIGQLAAGAAHEIRNPLASIRSTIQYLGRTLERDPESASLVAGLIDETDRINAIVEGMLAFARPAEPCLQEVQLPEVLAQTVRLVEPMARKARVRVATRFPPAHGPLHADPDQLKQVFLNVMMNGVQAMPAGGELDVEAAWLGPSPAGPRWRVEVRDSGTGIPPADLERIFDPFFTTKQDGTGLGLSICHAIVEADGGHMEVDSTVGRGTTLRLWL